MKNSSIRSLALFASVITLLGALLGQNAVNRQGSEWSGSYRIESGILCARLVNLSGDDRLVEIPRLGFEYIIWYIDSTGDRKSTENGGAVEIGESTIRFARGSKGSVHYTLDSFIGFDVKVPQDMITIESFEVRVRSIALGKLGGIGTGMDLENEFVRNTRTVVVLPKPAGRPE